MKPQLKVLLDQRYAGNVAKAAAAMGVERTTLMRIAEGFIENPRMDLVKAIADHFHVHVGWLLTGRGPVVREEGASDARWEQMVKSLKLPAHVAAALRGLPAMPWRAAEGMAREITDRPRGLLVFGLTGYFDEAEVWTRWLEGAIACYGRGPVSVWLTKRYEDLLAVRNAFTEGPVETPQRPA